MKEVIKESVWMADPSFILGGTHLIKTPVFSSKTFSKPVDNHTYLCYNKGVPRGSKKKKKRGKQK